MAKIAFIGKFKKIHDEEYIARSFEMLGHEVLRLDENNNLEMVFNQIMDYRPKFVLYTKLHNGGKVQDFLKNLRAFNIKAVSWVFDLYIGYPREFRLNHPSFKLANYVFTTDGGHDKEFKNLGLNHQCVRQGIYAPECVMLDDKKEFDVVFVGCENPIYSYRQEVMKKVAGKYNFHWFGRKDTNEVRGMDLNKLYAKSKIVIGDSVYSPYYWSNRIVETLGRGGFLIHQEVEGLKEEYPYLVTYKKGDIEDLFKKIDYYLGHDKEREELRKKNFEWVKERYTMDKKCAELINKL